MRLVWPILQNLMQYPIRDPNEIITDGPDMGKTRAMVWAEGLFNNRENQLGFYDQLKRLLHDYQFAAQITEETLNYIIEEGKYKGQSVAFWLARCAESQVFLSQRNCALGSKISSETLNHIIEEGECKGQSLAFWLSMGKEGQDLLAYADYALGSQITEATLNHIIPEGRGKGGSVALYLAGSIKGRYILV